MKLVMSIAACAALLAGCGETDQTKSASTTNRGDVAAWQGSKNGYVTQGWTQGNQGSWENQIRTRGQLQNEYVKTN